MVHWQTCSELNFTQVFVLSGKLKGRETPAAQRFSISPCSHRRTAVLTGLQLQLAARPIRDFFLSFLIQRQCLVLYLCVFAWSNPRYYGFSNSNSHLIFILWLLKVSSSVFTFNLTEINKYKEKDIIRQHSTAVVSHSLIRQTIRIIYHFQFRLSKINTCILMILKYFCSVEHVFFTQNSIRSIISCHAF